MLPMLYMQCYSHIRACYSGLYMSMKLISECMYDKVGIVDVQLFFIYRYIGFERDGERYNNKTEDGVTVIDR